MIITYHIYTVLGQLPPRKIAPNPKTNPNSNPSPNPNWGGGAISSGAVVRIPVYLSLNNFDPCENLLVMQ